MPVMKELLNNFTRYGAKVEEIEGISLEGIGSNGLNVLFDRVNILRTSSTHVRGRVFNTRGL